MKETLATIHQMKLDGVIEEYAIGGAVGATFYVEPMATLDLDVFVSFRQSSAKALISLSPIYAYLKGKGHEAKGEHVVIGGWPVQFLPASNPLVEEALAKATETEVEGVCTRIMAAEHLVAIALQLGRAKDHARILQFIEAGCLDMTRLDVIVARHDLGGRWARFQSRFMKDTP